MKTRVLVVTAVLISLAAGTWFYFHTAHPDGVAPVKRLGTERFEEEKPDMPMDAAAYWAARLKTQRGESPAALNLEIKKDVVKKRKAKSIAEPPPFKVEDFGPGNWGGRVRSIVIHPDDPDVMLTGGVSGGVWRTTDGGKRWSAQDDFMGNLAIGCMLADPDDPDTVYLGTGEGFCNGDRMFGWGIYKSADFGQTWQMLESTDSFDFVLVNRLARIPGSHILLAATLTGIHRSEDLGMSWTIVEPAQQGVLGFEDLKVDPTDSNHMFAYHFGSNSAQDIELTLTVHAPEEIAGEYAVRGAEFGPQLPDLGPVTADVVLYQDAAGSDLACEEAVNTADLDGKIALVTRGDCEFEDKVKNAQDAGAIAVIVINDRSGNPSPLTGRGKDITIPSVMISEFDGLLFRDFGAGLYVTLEGSTEDSYRYVMRSTDGGQSFSRLDSRQGLPITDLSRIEIAFGQDGRVYLMASNNNNGTRGLWRSDDGGERFYQTASTSRFIERQGCYNLIMGVDPSNSDRVFFGAIDVFLTTDGGDTIDQITTWAPGPGQIPHHVHADVHAMAFHPTNPEILWIGTDGGLFKTSNGGQYFETINHDLRIAQNYGLAVHPNGDRVITGTQDNGSMMFHGDTKVWLKWFGGDGGYCAWDQQDAGYIYGATPYAGLFGSPDGGNQLYGLSLPASDFSLFITPFILDPNDGNTMIVGTDKVIYSANVRDLGDAEWVVASPNFNGPVSALAISEHEGQIALAAAVGGEVFKTENLGQGNDFFPLSGLPADSYPTCIEIDPHDTTSNTMYISYAWYDVDRIFKTTDGGVTWTSIHGDLPPMPVFSLQVDPKNPNRLFAGTEVGLWVTESNMGQGFYHWSQYSYGTAWTRVVQMKWGDPDTLWVATHGRGTFKMSRNPIEIAFRMEELQGDGDIFLDLKEHHVMHVDLFNATQQNLERATVQLVSEHSGLRVLQPAQPSSPLGVGQTVSVPFELRLDALQEPMESANLQAIITTQNGTSTAPHEIVLGANPQDGSGTFHDGAETDGLMTHQADLGEDTWQRLEGLSNTGSSAWFCANAEALSDSYLATPLLEVVSSEASCSFWLYYNLEGDEDQYWDGAVVELRTPESDWMDMGHLISDVPYDGMLFNNNPLFLRHAWSGKQRSWRNAHFDLSTYQGDTIQIRFRVATDRGFAPSRAGFWLDDLEVSGVTWNDLPNPDGEACTQCDPTKGSNHPFLSFLAHTPTSAGAASYVGIVNADDAQATSVEIFGFADSGWVMGSHVFELPPNGKFFDTIQEIFPDTFGEIGWLQIGSERPIFAFAAIQSETVSSAFLASEELSDFVYLPHVAQNTERFSTMIAAVNGGPEIFESTLAPPTTDSQPIILANQHLPYNRVTTTASNLLGNEIQNISWATLEAESPHLAAMETFSVLPLGTQTASLGLNGDRGRTLRFLHIATDTAMFWTGMVYLNATDGFNQVNETYYDAQGQVLERRTVRLAAYEKNTLLFDHTTSQGPVPQGAAWLEVRGNKDLVGYELFGSSALSPHQFFAGLQGSFSAGTTILYPHLFSDATTWTGLVALNTGDASANVAFDLLAADGLVLETYIMENVAAKTKVTVLASDLFSQSSLDGSSWVRARADGSSWSGFVLWGDQGDGTRHHLAGIKAFVK